MSEPRGKYVIKEGTGEWSALYVDGQLHCVGDHYLITENVYELLGVEVEQTDDFMRGLDQRAAVAQTLDDVAEYRAVREEKKRRAQELRRQADALNDEAAVIDEQWGIR